MHHLVFTVAAHLGHYRFVAFYAVGNAVGEMQLVVVADLGALEVAEAVDILAKALLLVIVGLA